MNLWIALNLQSIIHIEQRRETRQEWKEIVLAYPGNTNNCKCKPCRYRRIYGIKS